MEHVVDDGDLDRELKALIDEMTTEQLQALLAAIIRRHPGLLQT